MKKILAVVVGLIILLVLVVGALLLSLNGVVLKTVNGAAPALLGVPVTLRHADISLLQGRATLQELHVGNPEGFKTDGLLDLGSLSVHIDNSTLLSDTIVIREILIDGLVVTYEQGLLGNNLGALLEQLSAGKDEPSPKDAPPAPQDDGTPAKKVVIEKLSITGSRMNVSLTGAAALTGGGTIPIPLPPITLTDLGKEKDGLTLPEAIREILGAISGAATTAISGAGQLLGDAGKALGQGALAVGEGALDAGQAVVGGTVDAGKAVVGGTVDAGKAVVGGAADAGKALVGGASDALKSINPFKK